MLEIVVNMRLLIFTMTMRTRLDLVFTIQRRVIDVRANDEVMYASIFLLETGIQAR